MYGKKDKKAQTSDQYSIKSGNQSQKSFSSKNSKLLNHSLNRTSSIFRIKDEELRIQAQQDEIVKSMKDF